MSRPDIDAAVRPLTRRMILLEAAHLSAGTYRRQRLRVPTLFVFGRCDHPFDRGVPQAAPHVPHQRDG